MELFTLLLYIHIAGGMTSLIVGFYVIMARKGDKNHRLVGLVFFYSMLISALISLPMALMHPNPFLFVVGVFTAYLLVTGQAYLHIKRVEDVRMRNWVYTGIMLLFGLGFLVMAARMFWIGNNFGTVMAVFGLISISLSALDYRNFKGKSKYSNFGLTTHIQRMVGAYIASVTAFVVVNNTLLPNVIAWLAPTFVFVPLVIIWQRKWGKRT
jgi:uncharacterized membrane protein